MPKMTITRVVGCVCPVCSMPIEVGTLGTNLMIEGVGGPIKRLHPQCAAQWYDNNLLVEKPKRKRTKR